MANKINSLIKKAKCKLQCWWNALLVKLTINVDNCPNKLCKCKSK